MVETKDGQPVRDESGHVKPLIDYPFAEDGLEIWYAMRDWFGEYLALYYDDNIPGKKVCMHDHIALLYAEHTAQEQKVSEISTDTCFVRVVQQKPGALLQ
jgi:hypothetical protein